MFDSGFQGLFSDFKAAIDVAKLPFKKPRKTKENPNIDLTDEEKAYNTALSQKRVVVENAISVLKTFRVMAEKTRMKGTIFQREVSIICCGLANLKISRFTKI